MEIPPDDRPSGPYRSHLLSFLRRQFLRWRESSQIAWRQARSASLWSLQVLAYPFYRWWPRGERQLAGAEADRTLAPESASLPLEGALAAVKDELAAVARIRAIACDCISRKPVAIASDGRVVPISHRLQDRLQAPKPANRNWRKMLWKRGGISTQSNFPAPAASGKAEIGPAPSRFWSPSTPEDPFSLAILIQSAIAYFFGPRASRQFVAAERAQLQVSTTPEDPQSIVEPSAFIPWLSYEDLFPGDLLPGPPDPYLTETEKPAPAGESESARSEAEGIEIPSFPARASEDSESEAAELLPAALRADVESDLPEYLNVEAVTRGYVRHPLEIVVTWLDRLLSWLEGRALGLWRSLSGLLRRRSR